MRGIEKAIEYLEKRTSRPVGGHGRREKSLQYRRNYHDLSFDASLSPLFFMHVHVCNKCLITEKEF